MCNGASSRVTLLWYRPTSEKWHASTFRKPDMTAGYLVSLCHRCTTALGKKRHQSYSSARRQRKIISGKVFTASLEKKKINKKMEAMPRKIGLWEKPRRAFLWRKFTSGVTDGACWGEPWQELYQGAEATPARGPSRPGHPQCPSARAGNQRCSVISLSSLSSLVK